ncbi:hypothetical protein [Catenovulum maritimum]|uniref:BIG2 domain-containing protein n=1 Tax=Catenovulum maritimum TaxID=1513271 RepID=A0A0J8GWF0_9ALTE|nr:hypothetical protein [Catenovulum maritimum]KMT67082.1 hypothetical protein XM47_00380 [Catenovulum maritimum]
MKVNLQKNKVLLAIASTALFGCGVDKGYDPERDNNSPLTFQTPYAFEATTDVKDELNENRYAKFDLLEGIAEKDSLDPTKIVLKDWVVEGNITKNGEVIGDLNLSGEKDLWYNGTTLILDRFGFDDEMTDAMDADGEVSANITLQYWVDNGYEYPCADMVQWPHRCTDAENAANPNIRTVTLSVKSTGVPTESIELEYAEGNQIGHTVEVGASNRPALTFNPVDAIKVPRTDISWTSSDESVFTIDDNGELTGIAAGTASLTVEYTLAGSDTPVILTEQVTVYDNLTGFTVADITVDMEQMVTPELTQVPATARPLVNSDFIFEVTNDSGEASVVNADGDISVAGIKQGTATLTVKRDPIGDTSFDDATASLVINNPINSFELTTPLYIEASDGTTKSAEFSLNPDKALTQITNSDFAWSLVVDSGALTLDQATGLLSAGAAIDQDQPGKATLTASYDSNGNTLMSDAEVFITSPLREIQLEENVEIFNGFSDSLEITTIPSIVVPQAASDYDWSITPGTGYATVDDDGVVTAVQLGTFTLTATSKNYAGISDSVEVSVVRPPQVKNVDRIILQDRNGNEFNQENGMYVVNVPRCSFIDVTPVAIPLTGTQLEDQNGLPIGSQLNFNSSIPARAIPEGETDAPAAFGSAIKLNSDDPNAQPHRVLVNESVERDTTADDSFNVEISLDNSKPDDASEDLKVTAKINIVENLLCQDAFYDGELSRNSFETPIQNQGPTRWTKFPGSYLPGVVLNDNGTSDSPLGNGLGFAANVHYEGNGYLYTKAGGTASAELVSMFADANQKWNVSYWIKVVEASVDPITVSFRVGAKTGGTPPWAQFFVDDQSVSVNNNQWQKIEYQVQGDFIDGFNFINRAEFQVKGSDGDNIRVYVDDFVISPAN